jgi:hypothetical protein
MDYSHFSVNFDTAAIAVLIGLIAAAAVLVLGRRRKSRAALVLGILSALVIGAWVAGSGLIETARTNRILKVADALAVPAGFEPGKAENFRDERIVRATAFMPCLAVTARCPSVHRQWSAHEGTVLSRADLENIIRDSSWQDSVIIEAKGCQFTYTNSSSISCQASGRIGEYDVWLNLSQTKGDVWRLVFVLEPAP